MYDQLLMRVLNRRADTPEQLQAFVDIGVRDFILRFADFQRLDGVRRFEREVAPKLKVG